ncbi:neuroligin-4, X-linked [Ctenocephalides felis]|uniref:neuroligin-4, X-linked n=2 Tax=Ctenocephalides felis TaxID=7515 RepID=UPI000E6E2F14|nr:neuroligin-4, X-linked [Ctenocephalides felis]
MDQIAALHWIQQNVALFGGDPESVTLMGHGTGAACIHFLMASPAVVPGLFHRAVLMSGSALGAWALVQRPVEYALKLARQVNCTPPTDMSREHETIVDCLREVPLASLLAAQVEPPKYLSAFGPSVDGVVIRSDFARDLLRRPSGFAGQGGGASGLDYNGASDWAGQLRSAGGSGLGADGSNKGQDRLGPVPHGQNKYDLLFGVVTSESLMRFSASDVQSGFEGNRRDRILRTYVRNAYTRHLSEIFYTVANEYTDWERTVQHPINTRDATVAALSDAQFVAPLVQTADLMISSRAHTGSSNSGTKSGSETLKDQNGEEDGGMKAYFYVFDYQTKDGDYPQRMGSVHGEELAYVFGAPLVDGFSHFPRNYTKSELALSEAVLIYWANFARTGNPNEIKKQEQVLPVSRERNRFRSIVWEQYDPVHQKYLEIGMKPRLKNHFRAHQLSVWLRLVPELHRSGSEDAGTRHNLFRHHSDPNLYDGLVRQLKDDAGNILTDDFDDLPPGGVNIIGGSNNNGLDGPGLYGEYVTCVTPTVAVNGMFNIQLANSTSLNSLHNINQESDQQAPPPSLHSDNAGYSAYSTALSVTIAVGCSLLILNVLIFAGVYYQRDKTRLEAKTVQQRGPTGATILNQSGALPHQGDHFMEATLVPSKRYVGSDVTNVRSDVDVERDVNALIMADTQRLRHLANSAVKSCNQTSTLPRNVAASQMMRQSDCLTLPRHAAGVIAEMQQTHNSGRFSTLQHPQQQNATNGPPNGSVPRPPPPPRCHSPTEHRPQQQLLQQQMLQQQQQQQMQTATLGRSQNRVPQAALSEMRV